MFGAGFVPLLVLIPFLSMILAGASKKEYVGYVSTALAAVYFVFVLLFWPSMAHLSFEATWFEYAGLSLSYSMLLDPYSYFLILLSAFLTVLCSIYSMKAVKKKQRAYHALFHALQGTVVACLLSDDLVFFYIFFEAMLIPMYFLIGIWGGKRRLYATTKFFIYTFAGSLFMLVGLISCLVIYNKATGEWTASFPVLKAFFNDQNIDATTQMWIFLSFILAFAIKVPLFPFHTWLPDAHTEAPTAGSVILAGILLKIGTYGMMRFAVPLFPAAAMSMATPLCVLSVVGIILGAVVAWRQTDMKKLIAYSSVSHLGFVTLGIFSATEIGWNGAFIQMINHGISTGVLFFLIGFIYDQKNSREINSFGGLGHKIPMFTLIFVIAAMSSVALPGTNGFVGEFMILLGSFQTVQISPWWVAVAGTGVILSAIYMLHLVQKLCYGQPGENSHGLKDFGKTEWVIYVPCVILIFLIGIYPRWILEPIGKTTYEILSSLPNAY